MDAALVVEELSKACAVCGRIAVEANMGALGAIMAYGTDAQRKLAAGLVLAGDKPAICITEPEAGSAATEMTTTAVRRGDRWIINGAKNWITGGGVSRLHLIFARAIEDGRSAGIGGFLVVRNGDGDPPGLVVRPPHPLHGPLRHAGGGAAIPRARRAGRHGAARAGRLRARLRPADRRL